MKSVPEDGDLWWKMTELAVNALMCAMWVAIVTIFRKLITERYDGKFDKVFSQLRRRVKCLLFFGSPCMGVSCG